MSFKIAVAGKGGTGKTSIASLIIRYLVKYGRGPVLAVDADPNANLGDSLGLRVSRTIGSIIATFNEEKINIPPGMTKESYLEFKLNESIVESRGLDLITMGRGEGADCYCYPNLVLKKFVDNLSGNYAYVVLDNEAGMEHLSRRTTEDVDTLLIISDPTVKGVRTIARIRELVSELKLTMAKELTIINGVRNGLDPAVAGEMDKLGIVLAATVPFDDNIYQYDLKLRPLLDLPDGSKAVKAVADLMTKIVPG